MRSLTLSSPAKVNLFLKVLGKRRDGYHELVTLFHRISLQDKIILRKIDHPSFRLITDHPKLKNPKQNLIYKAYRLLRKYASWKGGVEVKLKKRIPLAAGLGGGSSNAAFFLIGMNQLFNLGLPQKKLVQLAAQLGADVPFFLYEVNQAIGRGKGEKITPYPALKKHWFVLVLSSFELPTSVVYRRLHAPALTRISHDATITSAFSGPLRNDLFDASCAIRPELKQLEALFDRLGARRRLMSGSGPTMFSIHKSKREAERMARLIRRQRPKAKVFVCHTK
ncbi:MAG: 4-(cytidine 5'-diphospho)-2-C-methyl-D-erythritol kinase [Candidatus Omnitrophica bacterium]|nr:4-(cytidine 5'-diphospho)-2-C-methyl-D-erythritol kinase [Candidatus Omnitrophota bacterium]